jgi:ATP-binding cassette, subfamily B, bacterial
MIMKFYGKNISPSTVREKCQTTKEGVSLIKISDVAEQFGLRTLYLKVNFNKLNELQLPLIAHWRQRHFIVVYKVTRDIVYVADPAHGLIKYTVAEFCDGWTGVRNDVPVGVILLLEPTPEFEDLYLDDNERKKGLSYFYSYLKPHKAFFLQVILGLLFGSLIQFIFPFLTQSLVDHGIGNRDIEFIYLILFAQVSLLLGRTAVEFIRSWILLHVSTRISISLISDFISALMKKRLSFFDNRTIGDIMQRIGDHSRIQSFMTSSLFSAIFSVFNFIVYSVIILFYNTQIFGVFIAGSVIYAVWVILFFKKRKELDFKRFEKSAMNQSSLIQMVTGIQEIKLQNCEKLKRWEWEKVQSKLFRINIERLKWTQIQQVGATLINESKNIAITIIAAKLVIDGQITFGMMLALQYMIGMLNAPINEFISLLQQYQDAKISLERLSDVHFDKTDQNDSIGITHNIPKLNNSGSIILKNVSFKYEGSTELSLDCINVAIPLNKVTAIVGVSGSGKTTLLKLLLKFYKPTSGSISINDVDISTIDEVDWRNVCGAVLQDGFIFSDTIARNVAVVDEHIDNTRLVESLKSANLYDHIMGLPLRFQTKIGIEGKGLSQGQKQRILIARAIYKRPELLLLDEATNALDTKNEATIMDNLDILFGRKTVLIAAHRLSTIRRADQIIVLDKGKLVEIGPHDQLLKNGGYYHDLVMTQLDQIHN